MHWKFYFSFLLCCFFIGFGGSKRDVACNGKKRLKSFLWAIKREPPAYFFGTIHVPYTRVWSHVSQTAKEAFEASEQVYFELDLTDARTLSALSHCQLLPQDTDLSEVLPPKLFSRLKRHLDYVKGIMPKWVTSEQKGKGLYADTLYNAIVGNWKRKKPIWVMLMINSLTEADVKTRGTPVLDLHLAQKAERMGKTIGAVEQVDEQCRPLNGLNTSQVLFALDHTLTTLEKMRRGKLESTYTTDDLIRQYNCGELDEIMFDKESIQVPKISNESSDVTLSVDEIKANETNDVMGSDIDSYFKNELIYHRNERMAARVEVLLKENANQSLFFAFGAGHFLGNGSVIDFLKRHGYEIENVKNEIIYRDKPLLVLNGDNLSSSDLRQKRKKKKKRHRVNNKHHSRNLKRRNKRKQKRKKYKRTGRRFRSKTLPTFQTYIHHPDNGYSSNGHPQIRVIDRYTTVFPSIFYGDWSQRRKRKKKLETFESWFWDNRHYTIYNTELKGNNRKSELEVFHKKFFEHYKKQPGATGKAHAQSYSILTIVVIIFFVIILLFDYCLE